MIIWDLVTSCRAHHSIQTQLPERMTTGLPSHLVERKTCNSCEGKLKSSTENACASWLPTPQRSV